MIWAVHFSPSEWMFPRTAFSRGLSQLLTSSEWTLSRQSLPAVDFPIMSIPNNGCFQGYHIPVLKGTVPFSSFSKNGAFQRNLSPRNSPISLPLAPLAHHSTPMMEASKDISPSNNSFSQYSQSKEWIPLKRHPGPYFEQRFLPLSLPHACTLP